MEEIGILKFMKENSRQKHCKKLLLKKWLDYETNYLGFSTADSLRDEVEQYRENGYFGPGNTV